MELSLSVATSSSSPWYFPNTSATTYMACCTGEVNHARLSLGSGSQAPRYFHSPFTHTSIQAWLSSQCAHRGV